MPKKMHTPEKTRKPVQIIAFDFDGTITTQDTFALFLRYWAGTPLWTLKILKLLPIFIAYGLKFIDRNAVKVHVIRTFFKGADASALQSKADQFAQEIIPKLIRPHALETLKQKNKPPYTLYIVSASIEPYLLSWAKTHNIHNVLSTKLHVVNGRLTGEIDGLNCWGAGKTAKIASEMADTPYKIAEAYGDTRGDREMLHAAEASFWLPFRL
ncbi:MAG: HAD-IB family hydrolase [Robiginitomaculum sp.]|nr:MAG: HAD-IB family hydrolase [Robiginitomaculum sp.]